MTPLCALADIEEGTSKGFSTKDHNIIVIKKRGQLYAYLNNCPHLGIPLEWQPDHFLDDSNEMIQCSTHGALFLIESGLCVSGPCASQSLTPIPFVIKNQQLHLC